MIHPGQLNRHTLIALGTDSLAGADLVQMDNDRLAERIAAALDERHRIAAERRQREQGRSLDKKKVATSMRRESRQTSQVGSELDLLLVLVSSSSAADQAMNEYAIPQDKWVQDRE